MSRLPSILSALRYDPAAPEHVCRDLIRAIEAHAVSRGDSALASECSVEAEEIRERHEAALVEIQEDGEVVRRGELYAGRPGYLGKDPDGCWRLTRRVRPVGTKLEVPLFVPGDSLRHIGLLGSSAAREVIAARDAEAR